MRDLFITGLIFGLLPFVFKRPWLGILLWSWLGYMNPHRLAWGFAYNMPFSMIVGSVTILAFMASKEKKEMLWTREVIVLLILTGWMLFTTFFAFYPDLAWFQWNKVWKIMLMVLLTVLLINERYKQQQQQQKQKQHHHQRRGIPRAETDRHQSRRQQRNGARPGDDHSAHPLPPPAGCVFVGLVWSGLCFGFVWRRGF